MLSPPLPIEKDPEPDATGDSRIGRLMLFPKRVLAEAAAAAGALVVAKMVVVV
jgi:hypothetical protein